MESFSNFKIAVEYAEKRRSNLNLGQLLCNIEHGTKIIVRRKEKLNRNVS